MINTLREDAEGKMRFRICEFSANLISRFTSKSTESNSAKIHSLKVFIEYSSIFCQSI